MSRINNAERLMIQGVISAIEFPTNKDQQAVGKAISDLLREGWLFESVDEKHITLRRQWEVDMRPLMEQVKP